MLKFRLLLAQCNPSPQQHLFGAYAEIQIIFGTCVLCNPSPQQQLFGA